MPDWHAMCMRSCASCRCILISLRRLLPGPMARLRMLWVAVMDSLRLLCLQRCAGEVGNIAAFAALGAYGAIQ